MRSGRFGHRFTPTGYGGQGASEADDRSSTLLRVLDAEHLQAERSGLIPDQISRKIRHTYHIEHNLAEPGSQTEAGDPPGPLRGMGTGDTEIQPSNAEKRPLPPGERVDHKGRVTDQGPDSWRRCRTRW